MPYVLDLREIDRNQVGAVGGKAASLGELSRVSGVRVPPGFCVTTDAFRRGMAEDVATAITNALARHGEDAAYAVRSSATAEDAPTTSFAGQFDTYLNIVGPDAILEHVRRCWASLSTERAVAYRAQSGIDDRAAQMAVVVQRMVNADASGVLFTADPLTGNRKVVRVEGIRGLGEALVSGVASPQAVLNDAQLERLTQLGRTIEAHFGRPQDIEWCLANDEFYIVQSRPITTLYPMPAATDDERHVYISVGHGQMMTDAIKPLGLSVRRLTANTTFHEAGGREFVDATRQLASAPGRAALLALFKRTEPLVGDALQTIVDRGFIPLVASDKPAPHVPGAAPSPLETDPAIPAELIQRGNAANDEARREIATRSGTALFDFILADIPEFKRIMFDPRSHQAIMAGMEAAWWLNDHLERWLGEKNVADILAQSAPNNVTAEMGLDLLRVSDVVRDRPAEAAAAIRRWLDRYGMRGVGEIDITRPRWSERPDLLMPLILNNVRTAPSGEGERRFAQGLEAARGKEEEVLERLRALPDGEENARETKRMIDRLRTFAGYREYPKYFMVTRYYIYKQALMKEADRLVHAKVLRDREDVFFLTFEELREVVRTNAADHRLIRERRETFKEYERLAPPRIFTSDGEIITGSYRREHLPHGALAGMPVSAGTVEGRARIVFDPATADLEPGDILVTPYTDPSWTPVFVGIRGLVTEVGGTMTHGAVIAREYGLPAIVGVEGATRLIRDGQRIRVHGTEGYVELLTNEADRE